MRAEYMRHGGIAPTLHNDLQAVGRSASYAEETIAVWAIMMAAWIIIVPPWMRGAKGEARDAELPISRWEREETSAHHNFENRRACMRFLGWRTRHSFQQEVATWCGDE